jgi:hypothetical protein
MLDKVVLKAVQASTDRQRLYGDRGNIYPAGAVKR